MRRALLFLSLCCSCLPEVGPLLSDLDSGVSTIDASTPSDAGASNDGGLGSDGGRPLDAGVDAGQVDAGLGGLGALCANALACESGACTAGRCVAPSSTCGVYAACSVFEDFTAPQAQRIVTFTGMRYTPRCMRIRFGQSVTFEGSFSSHPMTAATCAPNTTGLTATSGQTLTHTFEQELGVYGYFCEQHGTNSGSGMAGAIEVVR